MHLIDYGAGDGRVLRFCEDATGLLVGPTDRRLGPAGLLVSNLRGGSYYENNGGDFRPGADVRLVPEPNNPHDDRAVAVFDRTGRYRAGYLNKQKARAYLKRVAAGENLVAISLRGTGPAHETGVVSIFAATPDVLAHVRSPRPPGCPPPVFKG
ncbi:HIRAN domain-containing protein [Modestobacter sp. VKM Ac-2979]|uniref:HIRAN domain-containing protein n=1 Tax=unclassified Modestobacter TaxID=2643866 RepID=UPI0022AB7601|nr:MULTISPECIES: HIRAN domain-containing protein [unclassified Modestobacter]MCZ2812023.1 HIRAN domain-containing protein [Modestobacter sp. VKM Ac-2979]MCZ2843747.1 HIRAN domain-containing protein [Modestobacter sp. VKM Ac-2980]